MAIPSGSGSEVLKSITQSITLAYTLTPTNDHIYTILNVIFKNNHGSSAHFDMEVSTDSGSSYIWLLEAQSFNQDETFVWSEKIILSDNTARLRITGNGSDNLHFMINYIDQDWS